MDSVSPISYDLHESSRTFRYFGLRTPGFWKGSILIAAKELRGSEEDIRAEVRPVIRAAEYVRMSTEHQKYSTENQGEAIRAYATTHGMKIVRTYAMQARAGSASKGVMHFRASSRMLKPAWQISRSFWFMTSAVGDGFRMPMNPPITNTFAAAQTFRPAYPVDPHTHYR